MWEKTASTPCIFWATAMKKAWQWEKDRKKALKLYRKGAENQSEEALYRLALYYSEEAEEKDETKAEEYGPQSLVRTFP